MPGHALAVRWPFLRRSDVFVGAALGTVTFAVYLLGSGRNYDYDSSETVGMFVATRSLLDPFRRQDVFNNHPLLSFVDHLVYSAGLHGPTALRALPVLFAAVAVALVAGWASRSWGVLAGICAALTWYYPGAVLAVGTLRLGWFDLAAIPLASLLLCDVVIQFVALVRVLDPPVSH